MERRNLGLLGEKLAAQFLKKKKYRIKETNFRCPGGEIDIVAEKDDFLVFVEVRTKTGTSFGTPEESVTRTKKARLTSSALSYIATRENLPASWRFDFVAVELDAQGKPKRIEVIENVID